MLNDTTIVKTNNIAYSYKIRQYEVKEYNDSTTSKDEVNSSNLVNSSNKSPVFFGKRGFS